MKAKNIFISTGIVLSAVLGVSTTAKAASFTTNFTPNPADPKKDIILQSIEQNGLVTSDFNFVTSAEIITNTGLTLGGASSDAGDEAGSPSAPNENPSAGEIASFLGNNNLNNIIDTEDDGEFDINVFFDEAVASNTFGVDSFFFWERGLNSDIQIQALGAGGPLGAAYTLTRDLWESAGYSIDTTEVTAAQPVGAFGVSFADLGLGAGDVVTGLKLSAHSTFAGPDFKVIAANFSIPSQDVPEPTTMLGLGSVAALALLRRRQIKKSASV